MAFRMAICCIKWYFWSQIANQTDAIANQTNWLTHRVSIRWIESLILLRVAITWSGWSIEVKVGVGLANPTDCVGDKRVGPSLPF